MGYSYDLKDFNKSFDVLIRLVAKLREGVAKTQGVCVFIYFLGFYFATLEYSFIMVLLLFGLFRLALVAKVVDFVTFRDFVAGDYDGKFQEIFARK